MSDSIVWQNRMFRGCLTGRPYPRDTRETQLSPSVLTLHIPVMCKALALLRRMLITIKSHNKYRVQKIEYNYNQIWHKIKANKTHSCKSQLYNEKDELGQILSPVTIYMNKTLLHTCATCATFKRSQSNPYICLGL